ncbi:MAG: hypothetical protein AB7V18_13135 [Pyrinomonadaceae bacterium]
MELEFDKEIDLLLRNGPRGEQTGEAANHHLDADELAAFAENAMPGKTRTLYVRHLADCDNCRKKLSGLIILNGEAAPPEADVVAPAVLTSAVPWYRRLFLFPDLAYIMGGLVLVFGGLITLTLLQNGSTEQATVSQIVENETGRGPMASEQLAQTESSNASASFANADTASNKPASNAAANAAAPPSGSALGSNVNAGRSEPAAKASKPAAPPADDLDMIQPAAGDPAPPPPVAEEKLVAKSEVSPAVKEDAEVEAKKKAAIEKDLRDAGTLSARQAPAKARTQAGGVARSTPGPTREMQQNFPNRADSTNELKSRRIGGKDFQFKNGAWYDNAYRGQATTNIRRSTDEYRKLDGGLRTIADGLSGVVVVVWKDKAYRIQ